MNEGSFSTGARCILISPETAARPFTVNLGERIVSVLGTEFNIYRQPERFTLAVTEGAVSLHALSESGNPNAPALELNGDSTKGAEVIDQQALLAGTVVEFDASTQQVAAYRPDNMNHLLEWRTGMLRFDEKPLHRVVQELNRYSVKKIVVDDSIHDLNIYATIKLDAISRALTGLEYSLPIKVENQFNKIVITGDDSQ